MFLKHDSNFQIILAIFFFTKFDGLLTTSLNKYRFQRIKIMFFYTEKLNIKRRVIRKSSNTWNVIMFKCNKFILNIYLNILNILLGLYLAVFIGPWDLLLVCVHVCSAVLGTTTTKGHWWLGTIKDKSASAGMGLALKIKLRASHMLVFQPWVIYPAL